MEINMLQQQLNEMLDVVIPQLQLKSGDLFVLGCSTSEIIGQSIGKASNLDIGRVVIQTFLDVLTPLNVALAVQSCEHLNRSLVVEESVMKSSNLEQVWVYPNLHAGGAASVAAYELFQSPVQVAHVNAKAGMDIGDTFIGMHFQQVVVPIRYQTPKLGQAHVTIATSRPKYYGGPRATYLSY